MAQACPELLDAVRAQRDSSMERVLALDLRSPLPSRDARGGVGEKILEVR